MEDLDEFIKLLRQIMSQECQPILSEEDIEQTIQEMGALELVGDRWVVWMLEL